MDQYILNIGIPNIKHYCKFLFHDKIVPFEHIDSNLLLLSLFDMIHVKLLSNVVEAQCFSHINTISCEILIVDVQGF